MYDAINEKWHDLLAACNKFNEIFENLKNIHKSSSNNFNILSTHATNSSLPTTVNRSATKKRG